MSFREFRCFVITGWRVISADLDKMESIAEIANQASYSSSTTFETTRRPEDINDCENEMKYISRCTIPIAMSCFSIMDMIGHWLNENEHDDFGVAARNFLETFSEKEDLKNLEQIVKIKDKFRNGIMHSFFARSGFSLTYPNFEGNCLFLNIDGVGTTLDVRYLLKLVRTGMDKLIGILDIKENEITQKLHRGFLRWDTKQ